MPSTAAQTIADNYRRVCQRVVDAAIKVVRDPRDVTIVAVSKYVGVAETQALLAAGAIDLGESRPQQLWEKAPLEELSPARWHLIGHLQRNKVERTVPLVELIHSVDSRRLLSAINKAAAAVGITSKILLEINCSGDTAKHGLTPDQAKGLCETLNDFPSVRVEGLMTMAARQGGSDVASENFADLRRLRDQLCTTYCDLALPELSMGMSGDFEAAIAEGATLVRLGSILFENVS